jgi:hypothetical protein
MEMTNQQTQYNNQNDINIKNYLITEKSDIQSFSKKKINNDLEAIKKAELRAKQQLDITMDKKEGAITRAMKALSLINPFKGV